jgi:hypothetical protein
VLSRENQRTVSAMLAMDIIRYPIISIVIFFSFLIAKIIENESTYCMSLLIIVFYNM